MKIVCKKCNLSVTNKDLMPIQMKRGYIQKDNTDHPQTIVRPGSFFIERKTKTAWNFEQHEIEGYNITIHRPEALVISKFDVNEDIIPVFKEGYGCCDYGFGEKLHCTCGNLIGLMSFDCFEEHALRVLPKQVRRVYKS